MNISKNSVVTIHYTLKDDQGKTLDSSSDGEPLMYLHGMGGLIPGLEKALENRVVGDKFEVTIAPENGYGVRDDQMIRSLPKKQFQDAANLKVGMQFNVKTKDGPLLLTVTELKDDEVVVDGNHPLAGMTLHFAVEVTEVRKATDEELKHGHAHGAHGHHH